jgi:hypothetical protein
VEAIGVQVCCVHVRQRYRVVRVMRTHGVRCRVLQVSQFRLGMLDCVEQGVGVVAGVGGEYERINPKADFSRVIRAA